MSIMLDRPVEAGAGTLHNHPRGAVRSYDHRGLSFSWEPPPGLDFSYAALDVEAKDQLSASGMSARFGLPLATFLRRWTATEAIAKVLDVPILEFLKLHGLSPEASETWQRGADDVRLRSIDCSTHWVTVALRT